MTTPRPIGHLDDSWSRGQLMRIIFDRPQKGWLTPKRDDWPQKGWPISKGMTDPKKWWPTLKGTTNLWADESGNPWSWRPIPLAFPWGLYGAHSRILAWKLLAHHDQRPYHAIRSLIYGIVIPSILGLFSLQGRSPYQGIQVSSLPL